MTGKDVNYFTFCLQMIITPSCMLVLLAFLGSAGAIKHYPVGKSLYLPKQDLMNPNFDGKNIFQHFDENCYISVDTDRRTVEKRSYFHDTEDFYKKISTDSGVDAKLQGSYTMGATLNTKTQSLSSGSVDVSGTTINIWTYVASTSLNPKCYKGSGIQLNGDLIEQLDSLPSKIDKPELESSWIQYDNFLKIYGTHLVSKVNYGAKITQWTFAKKKNRYTNFQLKVKSCADFGGITSAGKFSVDACAGVTTQDISDSKHYDMSFSLDILGGTDKTRNLLRQKRSQELITKLLTEGRAARTPVAYSYIAIWEILMLKFYNNPKRRAVAINMQQYYEGFKDFGCSLIQEVDGRLKNTPLRSFRLSRFSKPDFPSYECRLERQGCHSDSDCHIGGAGSVTYCYGSSCVEYVSPSFGSKATGAKIRRDQSGSYYEGVNNSCYYHIGVWGACNQDYFGGKVIWQGIDRNSDMIAQYNL